MLFSFDGDQSAAFNEGVEGKDQKHGYTRSLSARQEYHGEFLLLGLSVGRCMRRFGVLLLPFWVLVGMAVVVAMIMIVSMCMLMLHKNSFEEEHEEVAKEKVEVGLVEGRLPNVLPHVHRLQSVKEHFGNELENRKAEHHTACEQREEGAKLLGHVGTSWAEEVQRDEEAGSGKNEGEEILGDCVRRHRVIVDILHVIICTS